MIGIGYLKPNKVQTMFWFSSNDTKAILQGEKSLEEEDCSFGDGNALNHILEPNSCLRWLKEVYLDLVYGDYDVDANET